MSSVSWRDDYPVFHPIRGMELAPARRGLVPYGGRRYPGQGQRIAGIAMDVVALYGLCAYGSRANLQSA